MGILVTAFDPFGGERINPAQEVLRRLPGTVGGRAVHALTVPTAFGQSLDSAVAAIRANAPRDIVCLGQAGGRRGITVERVAINWMDAGIPDNAGRQPKDEAIAPDGPAAYFATLPVLKMVDAIRAAGLPAAVSLSAGAFVCNYLLYGVLHFLAREGIPARAGFIHLPFLPEQAGGRPGAPAMALEDMVRGVTLALGALAEDHNT